MASTMLGSSGATFDRKRRTTCPSLLIAIGVMGAVLQTATLWAFRRLTA